MTSLIFIGYFGDTFYDFNTSRSASNNIFDNDFFNDSTEIKKENG